MACGFKPYAHMHERMSFLISAIFSNRSRSDTVKIEVQDGKAFREAYGINKELSISQREKKKIHRQYE